MLLDRSHRGWAIFSILVLAAAAVAYVLFARTTPGGAVGGDFWGLVFGITGTAFILFAALLGVRKKRPHARWGRASTWLKGHLWLGALSLPLILFHGGFRFGGTFTSVLMWTFVLVFVTGVVGLALQNVLPRLMTRHVPQETVYEQIDHVLEQLFDDALGLAQGDPKKRGAAVAKAKAGAKTQGRVVSGRQVTEEEESQGPDERVPLLRFVQGELKRYFEPRGARSSPLFDPHRRSAVFSDLRAQLVPELHAISRDLEALCEQRAQIEIQRRLHLWLHGWLLVHVPLSWAVVVLTAVHAAMSLYY